MRKLKWILTILAFCFAQKGYMQSHFPSFKSLRFEEDYSFLKGDTTPSTYKRLKYIRLNQKSDAFASFGGDFRYQYFRIEHEDWGDSPKDKDGFVLSRLLVHGDLHVTPALRSFIQLQGSMANGKASGTSAVDENPLDLHQAFVDVKSSTGHLVFRLGRQELSYGSQRLIAVRELPNNRHAFDAAKAVFRRNKLQLDFFYSRYVVAQRGLFDDASGRNIQLWGGYAVVNTSSNLLNADFYYLGLHRAKAVFDDGAGNEDRHSLGMRLWKQPNPFRYDVEVVYQFGNFIDKTVGAWTASANIGYQLRSVALQPEIGLKTEVISGDRKKGDGRLQTFNPLFPRGAYFGLAALIGPSNLVDVHPSLKMSFCKKKLSWSVDYNAFWRQSTNDGLYAPNTTLLYSAKGSPNQFIGHQYATDAVYTPNPFLLMRMETTLFAPGSYLKDVSAGKKILFFGFTTQLKF